MADTTQNTSSQDTANRDTANRDPAGEDRAGSGGSVPFGFETVDPSEKTRRVGDVFSRVASRYDVMNDAMSLGVHRLWKARFVDLVRPRPGHALLDLAGGTGDIAFALLKTQTRRARADTRATGTPVPTVGTPPVTICDISEAMLRVGRDRAIDGGLMAATRWVTGNAEELPLPSNRFDRVTIAFGLRNVTHIDRALAEMARVLKPGGRLFCLEFSKVVVPGFDRLYDAYSFAAIPRLGQWIAGDRDSYQYLVESIRTFPDQPGLAQRMRNAGLARARWENLSGGIAAIHQAVKV